MTCPLCWRRRLQMVLPVLVLLLGLAWMGYLVVWDRPMVPCGTQWDPASAQMATLYCRAAGPVWP